MLKRQPAGTSCSCCFSGLIQSTPAWLMRCSRVLLLTSLQLKPTASSTTRCERCGLKPKPFFSRPVPTRITCHLRERLEPQAQHWVGSAGDQAAERGARCGRGGAGGDGWTGGEWFDLFF